MLKRDHVDVINEFLSGMLTYADAFNTLITKYGYTENNARFALQPE